MATARPENELFWFAFDHSANPMALLRLNRVIAAVNEALHTSLGYNPEEVLGRVCDMFVAPDWWRRLEADWRVLRRSGSVHGHREFLRADGRRVRVQFAAATAQLESERLVLFVVLDQQLAGPQARSLDGRTRGQLTPRELQVVSRIAMGRRTHEVATALGISPATAQKHVRNAMHKLGARSQAQLVALALASEQLQLGEIQEAKRAA